MYACFSDCISGHACESFVIVPVLEYVQMLYFPKSSRVLFQYESLLSEHEQMKEKLEEVSLELEILRSEINEGGLPRPF